jgi:hypothetical protein
VSSCVPLGSFVTNVMVAVLKVTVLTVTAEINRGVVSAAVQKLV